MSDPELELDPQWRRPFELAWASMRYGSFPVGAVILDPTGEVVTEGRNRIYEVAGPVGQLAGTSLAHAEINTLGQLPDGQYGDHVLWTTLEPCLLCTSALRMSRVGNVHFAAADRFWNGVQDIPRVISERAAEHWTKRRGPAGGLAQLLGGVLPALWYLKVRPAYIPELEIPGELADLARHLRAEGVQDAEDVDDLIAALQNARLRA